MVPNITEGTLCIWHSPLSESTFVLRPTGPPPSSQHTGAKAAARHSCIEPSVRYPRLPCLPCLPSSGVVSAR